MNKIYKNQKGFTVVEFLLVVIVLVIIGAAGYLVAKHINNKAHPVNTTTASNNSQANTSSHNSSPSPAPKNQAYTSKIGGFTISYPQTWSIEGFTGQYNTTIVPASQLDGTENSVMISSSSAKSNSFGLWLSVSDTSSPTSSLNSAFTQIPYNQGKVIKTLQNGVGIWEANQSTTTNGHTNPVTCTPFETVSNGAFGYKLKNGKYLDGAMSFCYANGQTTTKSYGQQADSAELQQAIAIISSLKQS